ncbi:hypothetical protein AKJ09_01749 [Labilithrix luteola]|uniref:Uncharacterized protein n=1 Tax=Labilithrix luteola TaxID=1391654 RepID=A0A0K1PNG7_9BACT|nr:hypothetical protein AKJ09_01749 [Labilithrix luteola]
MDAEVLGLAAATERPGRHVVDFENERDASLREALVTWFGPPRFS